MAEGGDDEDKTEEPTHKKLREAREKGQVAQSREVNTWFMLFASALLFVWMGGWLGTRLTEMMKDFIARPEDFNTDPGALREVMRVTATEMLKLILIPMGVLFIAGIVAGIGQVGPMLSAESMKPNLDKINPMKGFARVFGTRAWIEFAKSLFKLLLVGTAATVVLWPFINNADSLVGIDHSEMMDILTREVKKLFNVILSILFVFAAIDFGIQRFQLMKQLRMSKQEIKDEYKQTEGDPHIKAKLRELRMRRARKRMMANVPKADVIVTNPTHYALALEYNKVKAGAPVVTAKGVDRIALKIREIAKENNVPIVENPPLARAMYDTVELDEEIPEQHYKAVAEIISYVYGLKRR